MKCQILFSWKNKKNIIGLSSAESAHSVVSVNNYNYFHADINSLFMYTYLLYHGINVLHPPLVFERIWLLQSCTPHHYRKTTIKKILKISEILCILTISICIKKLVFLIFTEKLELDISSKLSPEN